MKLNSIFFWLLLISNVISYFVSSHVGYFDAAIFRLQLLYPTVGIFPEKDFIVFYPLGLSIVSKLISQLSAGYINPIMLIWPIHFLLQLKLVNNLYQMLGRLNCLSAVCLILILETFGFAIVGTEPFSLLVSIIVLLELYKFDQNKSNSKTLIAWLVALVFLRWDRFIYTMLVWLCYLLIRKTRGDKENPSGRERVLLYYMYALSIFFFITYSCEPEYFWSTIKHTFYDPFVIGRYRSKHFSFDFNLFNVNNWYLVVLGFYLVVLLKNLNSQFNAPKVFFYLIGLCFVPYTVSRPDISHFFPFIISSSMAFVLILEGKLDYSYLKIVNVVALVIAASYSMFQNWHKAIDSCSRFPTEGYKSIFVGNNDYANFVINFPTLYLKNIKLKPATKYISDEPGMQNNCGVQREMIVDFIKAKKPTIFFFNKTQMVDKNNNNSWTSCGLLEDYFDHNTQSIGECYLSNYKLDVRTSL